MGSPKRLSAAGRAWADAATGDMSSRLAKAAAAAPPLPAAERTRILRTLYLMQFCWLSSMLLGMEAKMSVYLRHWSGDTARYIRVNSFGQSAMNLSSLFLTPLFAAMADARGRRGLLQLGTRFAAALRLLELALPIPRALTIAQCLNGITMASQTGSFISVTDLFPGDAQGAAGAMALMQMSNMAAVTFSPMIGTALAAHSATAVFVLSAACAGLNALLAMTVPETQHRNQRLPLSSRGGLLRVLNPFGFVQLFRRGRRLALLSLTEVLFMMTEPRNVSRGSMLVNGASLGWSVPEAVRFTIFVKPNQPTEHAHRQQHRRGKVSGTRERNSCIAANIVVGMVARMHHDARRAVSPRWKDSVIFRAISSPLPLSGPWALAARSSVVV